MARPYAKDTSIPYAPTDDIDLYPSEDGKPMAASDYHLRLLIWTLQALETHFAQNPEVYISGDLMMYYSEGDPRKSISPDVLVCFGINPKLRLTYKTWEEGKAPDFVMEFSSKSTYDKDLGEKKDVYASLRIQNYFLYDAEGLYLPSPMMGFTLVDGEYVAISADERGGFRASVLDLDFHIRDGEIAIYDPIVGEWLQTRAERTEIAEARAENAEARAENAEAHAEQETNARQNAEAELAKALAEIKRLRTE
ncbi:MAG: Uma2 family endonuclease [Candidatus Poribacteria bacterium]|nr:Uma2 family endonuclease [Candidatus Poribacteria bacterium]